MNGQGGSYTDPFYTVLYVWSYANYIVNVNIDFTNVILLLCCVNLRKMKTTRG